MGLRLISLILLPAAAYQVLAIIAELRHLRKSRRESRQRKNRYISTGVSVLKPLRGLDPNTYEAFLSQAVQDYPTFEIVFGVRDDKDPAVKEVLRLQKEFPQISIQLIVGGEDAPNGKVGLLAELARHAKYPIWIINDSDIKVTPEYMSTVTAPLADESIGVVTCLYRVKAHTLPAAWESFGIATDFMSSVLVAQMIGVREFGLGSTLAFRARDLERAGGFPAIADYLADDYQLAKRITALGKRALVSCYTVETSLGDDTWLGIWRHQLRWARTIRFSKGAGYAGLPITQAGLWVLIALLCGGTGPALLLLALRIASALVNAGFVLSSRAAAIFCWLAPFWDVYSFAVWLTSYAGKEVRWRDRVLNIDAEGRILP